MQQIAYPLISSRKSVLVASHTGSGKTLAYLLPITGELKRQEVEEGYIGKPRRPRALLLSPTRELTDQIGSVARQLSHFAKLRTTVLNTGIKYVLNYVNQMFQASLIETLIGKSLCD